MDKEEAKHLSDVLKAYSENKIIQIRTCKGWEDVLDDKIKFCGSPEDYRIKPEPKIRPYANAEEFLAAQKEHGPYLQRMRNAVFCIPTLVGDKNIEFHSNITDSYENLLELGNWQDGTPCGIIEK